MGETTFPRALVHRFSHQHLLSCVKNQTPKYAKPMAINVFFITRLSLSQQMVCLQKWCVVFCCSKYRPVSSLMGPHQHAPVRVKVHKVISNAH